MVIALSTANSRLSILILGLGLAFTTGFAHAEHIDPQQAQHLLQWGKRQPFFETWLRPKQQYNKEPLKGLLEGHSEFSGSYRTTKTLASNYLTLDQLNYLWLKQAIKAYQRQDWLDAEHSLSQLIQPLNALLSPSVTLLQQATSIQTQRPLSRASSIADPQLSTLSVYNQALTLVNSRQFNQALERLQQLQQAAPEHDKLLGGRDKLLQAFILTQTQDPEQAALLLNSINETHPLFSLKRWVEAQTHLGTGEYSRQIALLLKQSQLSPAQISTTNIELLEALQQQGAQTQAALLASQWLLPLQRAYIETLGKIKQVTSAAFLSQLGLRQSGESATELVSLLSQDSRLLLTEIERINFLSHQFREQIRLMPQQQQLFNRGHNQLKEQLHKYSDIMPSSGARLPDNILNGNPLILELESRLSELVGQPQSWPHRYVLLDGITIWYTGEPFKNRWWEPSASKPSISVDLVTANQELAKFATEQFSKTSLLEEIRFEQELPKLPGLAQRADSMLVQLEQQKKRLLSALGASLQFEPAQMVAQLEQDLLWLATQIAPRARQFDQPELQLWFESEPSASRSLPENTEIPYELALSALQALADNALNTQIQHQALRHLADLKLLVSERILNGDPIPPRPDLTPKSAISLYLKLLNLADPRINRPQIYYQLAKAYELNGEPEQTLAALQQLINSAPEHPLQAEIQFRIAELQFGLRHYDLATQTYLAVLNSDKNDEYADKARYKRAWSAFKQGEYSAALEDFFILVERHWPDASNTNTQIEQQLSTRSNQALLDDTLRVIALTFAYMNGADSLQQYFSRVGPKPYETQVYRNLGAYFEYKRSYTDTAETFNAMVERFPQSEEAPLLQSRVVTAYTQGGFPSKAWPAREHFIERFGIHSAAWQQADPNQRDRISVHLAGYLVELAQRDHALAQQSALGSNPTAESLQQRHHHFSLALGWYAQFISAMPADPRLPEMLFLKAEALNETGQQQLAASTYQQVAYQYPQHPRSAEAGYAALLAYQSLYLNAAKGTPEAEKWLQTGIEQSLHFSQVFADSGYTPKVQTKLAEDLLIQNNNTEAISAAAALLQGDASLSIELQQRLWRVIAHANFDAKQYPDAEQAYQQLLLLSPEPAELDTLLRRLAESIYQQGEQALKEGNQLIALGHYQRLGQIVPGAHILPQADFDAATLLLQLERWPEAVVALERFSTVHPTSPLQATIDDKKVVAYEQTQNWPKAALSLERIFEREQGSALGRDALWRSALLQEKANQPTLAIQAYQRFVDVFSSPHEAAMEARLKLYQLHQQLDDSTAQQRWLQTLVNTEILASTAKGADASTDRSLFIASAAALTLGKQSLSDFLMQPLNLPLEKSLPRKRKAMETSIRYLTQTSNFGLSLQATEATALIGQLYQQFAQALMSSQRPKQLDELALEQYDILLEEQALPFEDKAISLHEINVSRIVQDIYTPGIATSLDELRQMMPARYAKDERVPEYTDALE